MMSLVRWLLTNALILPWKVLVNEEKVHCIFDAKRNARAWLFKDVSIARGRVMARNDRFMSPRHALRKLIAVDSQ